MRGRHPSIAVLAAAVALLAACSGSTAVDGGASTGATAGGGTGGGTDSQTCLGYANAICGLYQSCSNGFQTSLDFGDLATCVDRYQILCLNRLALPGTALTATQIAACATALPQESCLNLYGSDSTAPCEAAQGSLANGAACGGSALCQSAFCALPKYGICGVCATQPLAGADCSVTACGQGLICLKASQTCSAPVAAGGACTNLSDCQFGLTCLDGDGGPFACGPTAAAGQPCDYRALVGPGCDGREGLYCKRSGDGGSCTPIGLADAGQACGDVGGLATDCAQEGVCQKAQPDAGEGLCLGAAADGQPCDIDAGPACLPEAKCVLASASGTAGVCMQPVTGSCP